MTTLGQARELLAAALTAVDGVTEVVAHGIKAQLRPGCGWTRVTAVQPAGFRTANATLEAYLVLGPDETSAEQQLEDLAVPLLDAASTIDELPGFGFSVEPAVMSVSPQQSLFVVVVSLTTEVSAP